MAICNLSWCYTKQAKRGRAGGNGRMPNVNCVKSLRITKAEDQESLGTLAKFSPRLRKMGGDKYMIRFVLICLGLLSLHGAAWGQTLTGWPAIVDEIGQTDADRIETLNGRSYVVTLNGAQGSDLVVSPVEAFTVERTGASWRVTISNAAALVVNDGNLAVKRDVAWKAIIGGVRNFPLALRGIGNCQFTVDFSQVGSGPLDLERLSATYNISWTFSNPSIVESAEIKGSGLAVQRRRGSSGVLTVVLRARNSAGTIDARSSPVAIPLCGEYVPDSGSTTSIVQFRNPAQCMVPLGTRTDMLSRTGIAGQRFRARYANTCDRPIRCEMVWRMTYYANDADYEALRNGELVATHRESEVWGANQERQFDFEISAAFRNRPVFYTGHFVPDQSVQGYQNSDYQCRWA